MKIWRRRLLAFAAATLLPVAVASLPGVALAEVIDCKMDPGFNRWYIAPVIRVDIGEGGAVKVSDDLIRSTDRKSVFGEVAKDTEKQLVIAWELRDLQANPADKPGHGLSRTVSTRLLVKRPTLAVSVTVQVPFYKTKTYQASGRCKVVE